MNGCKRKRRIGLKRKAVECSYCSIVVDGCLAIYVDSMIDKSIVDAAVVEIIACRIVFAE